MHTLLVLTIRACMLLITPAASAQSPPDTTSPAQPTTPSASIPTDNSDSAIQAHIALVDAELVEIESANAAGSPNLTDWAKQWSGRYCDGTGTGGDFIRIAAKSGVAFTFNVGCLGPVFADHATITEVLPDGLRLSPAVGNRRAEKDMPTRGLEDRLYFLRWDSRRFVVPESQMLELVNDYIDGAFETDHFFRLLEQQPWPSSLKPTNRGSIPKPPKGRPNLPKPWADLLRDTPVRFTVTSASPIKANTTPGTGTTYTSTLHLTGGRDRGAFLGMQFTIKPAANAESATVEITEITESTCIAEFTAIGQQGKPVPAPKTGDQIGTRGTVPASPASIDKKPNDEPQK